MHFPKLPISVEAALLSGNEETNEYPSFEGKVPTLYVPRLVGSLDFQNGGSTQW